MSQKTITLAEYMATDQAREDVYAVIGVRGVIRRTWGTLAELRTDGIAWMQIQCKVGKSCRTVYYRPDGDRFIVTDLGEGVRALRLKGMEAGDANERIRQHIASLASDKVGDKIGAPFQLRNDEIGFPMAIEAQWLPNAICRVMLASLRVAGVGR